MAHTNSSEQLQTLAVEICKEQDLELLEHVGAGAFKHVYRARDKNGESVALKLIKRQGASERTAREINAIRRCNHPHIARIHKFGEFKIGDQSNDYVIEQFYCGGTLTDRLKDGCLSRDVTREIASSLISAIDHIAELGLVHRDIKPDNIMFGDDGTSPALVDFGLVRDLKDVSLTQSWHARGPGTPYYASPEQLNNEKYLIDWRADQFALGVVLAHAHFGCHPYQTEDEQLYDGRTVDRVADRGSHADAFAAKANAAGFDQLVKMTAPWPVNRYRTARQLEAAWEVEHGE